MKKFGTLGIVAAALVGVAGVGGAPGTALEHPAAAAETLTMAANLKGLGDAPGTGIALYTWTGAVTGKRLDVRITDATPLARLEVSIQGRVIGTITTDEEGNAAKAFFGFLPGGEIKSGMVLRVGELAGRLQ
jgi:hypothetical protein